MLGSVRDHLEVVDIEKNCLFNVVIVSFHVNISSQLSFYDFVYIM